ncbi:exodeoxyribonuclease I [Piscinibacter sakaiensis]|uniref:exodeoxyribonuclease I n=1 Tax=Piscinibacter sakaiensis TaxID=1547922 RepID=UPI003AAC71AD
MSNFSFYWHDYETFGRSPRRDRPSQFAGIRTDAELNEVGAPRMMFCRPAPDYLPEPEACLLTGILPQQCLAEGVAEHEFAAQIESELAFPGTVGVGYNSIRFDDEVTRFLFWRSLIDPYAREWQNECGRWDLLDVLRCCHALRPDGISWPRNELGQPSFKLEHLTQANGLAHDAAHDALSDVRATIALARLVRQNQPRLWDFCLRLRSKHEVVREMNRAQQAGAPFLHISGMYGTERGCLAIVWPLAPHPTNRNELIVWDLAFDPSELFTLGVAEIRERLFSRADALPAGVERLPIKTIHLNKSPVVISNLKTLGDERAADWGIDIAAAHRHAQLAAQHGPSMAGIWPGVFERAVDPASVIDIDEDLYGGFVSNDDRRVLQRIRATEPEQLADRPHVFDDPRLAELVFRYRARNFPQTLSPAENLRWESHRADRLHGGAGGAQTLQAYFEHIDELGEATDDERSQQILGDLVEYATEIAPEHH